CGEIALSFPFELLERLSDVASVVVVEECPARALGLSNDIHGFFDRDAFAEGLARLAQQSAEVALEVRGRLRPVYACRAVAGHGAPRCSLRLECGEHFQP